MKLVIFLVAFIPCISLAFSQWTGWYDTDRPGGKCDCECTTCHAPRGKPTPCAKEGEMIGSVECRRQSTGQVFTQATSGSMPNIFGAGYDCTNAGLMCWNQANIAARRPRCENYAIRYFCVPNITTTAAPPPECKCPRCPSGWTAHGDRCFISFGCANVPCSHMDARRRCHAMGGRQARVLNMEDNEFVSSFVDSSVSRVLIAGNDETTEGTWRFLNDTDSLDYTNWNYGQPDNAVGNEDCAAVMAKQMTKWDDVACCQRFGHDTAFVCEKEPCCNDG